MSKQEVIIETPESVAAGLAGMRAKLGDSIVPGIGSLDAHLKMFLRAMKYDVDRAAKLYGKYWPARKEWFGDGPITCTEDIKSTIKLGALCKSGKKDKEGRQVMYMRLGRVDYTVTTPKLMAKTMWYNVHLLLQVEATQIKGIIVINDLADIKMSNFRRETIKLTSNAIQNQLPVRVGGIFMVNQPSFFNAMFFIVKQFLKEKLRKRIKLMGSDYQQLKEYFDDEALTTSLGGTLVLADGGADLSNPPIPEQHLIDSMNAQKTSHQV